MRLKNMVFALILALLPLAAQAQPKFELKPIEIPSQADAIPLYPDGELPSADRPAFVGYIYGPMTAGEVPENAPPPFVALALDEFMAWMGMHGRLVGASGSSAP